jgi:hypothetical protein
MISIAISADQWLDVVRLSDIEDRFVCTACGKRGPTCAFRWHLKAPARPDPLAIKKPPASPGGL